MTTYLDNYTCSLLMHFITKESKLKERNQIHLWVSRAWARTSQNNMLQDYNKCMMIDITDCKCVPTTRSMKDNQGKIIQAILRNFIANVKHSTGKCVYKTSKYRCIK